ncbi:MAG: hypothetical protein ACE5GK_05430 [Nitrospiria bacterium]
MDIIRGTIGIGFAIALIGMGSFAPPASANGEHGDHAAEEKKMDMEMHHHSPSSKKGPELPPGTKEVKIDLSGPFCHKHPEEITEGLMKLKGVIHVEAFSGRRYILVHFTGNTVGAKEMSDVVSQLKGSGWRCKGTVSSKKQTER